MRQVSHITRLCEAYAAHKSRSPHTVGRLASGDGNFYRRIVNGGDITSRRNAKILHWFSTHWPTDLDWPHDIARPFATPLSSATTDPVEDGGPVEGATHCNGQPSAPDGDPHPPDSHTHDVGAEAATPGRTPDPRHDAIIQAIEKQFGHLADLDPVMVRTRWLDQNGCLKNVAAWSQDRTTKMYAYNPANVRRAINVYGLPHPAVRDPQGRDIGAKAGQWPPRQSTVVSDTYHIVWDLARLGDARFRSQRSEIEDLEPLSE